MKFNKISTRYILLSLGLSLAFLLSACGSGGTPTPTPSPTDIPAKAEAAPAPAQKAEDEPASAEENPNMVINTENDGPGSLRMLIDEASPGDVITFDPQIFKPDQPATIHIQKNPLNLKGDVTIDASNAGVILDGKDGPEVGIMIQSNGNVVSGLKITNFSLGGIMIDGENQSDKGRDNIIGGDRTQGSGPFGQGNCFGNNGTAIFIQRGVSGNMVKGNLIGIDNQDKAIGNQETGIVVQAGANQNTIGPDNIIANNGDFGIKIEGSEGTTITRNSIFNYKTAPFNMTNTADFKVNPEVRNILCAKGLVEGELVSPQITTIEVFSGDESGVKFYEGSIQSDIVAENEGDDVHIPFTLDTGTAFKGSSLYFSGTMKDGKTTYFSDAIACEGSQQNGPNFGKDAVQNTLFTNWHQIWKENVHAMTENQGGHFSAGSTRTLNEEEGVFEFSESPGEGMFAKLNTPLDKYCDKDCLAGYAFMMDFRLNGHIYMGLGRADSPDANEFGLELTGSKQPEIIWTSEFRKESLAGDLKIDPAIWYSMMIAIKPDGQYRVLIWETDKPENMATYVDNFAEHEKPEGYMNTSWVFKMYGMNGKEKLQVKEYKVINFEDFKQ